MEKVILNAETRQEHGKQFNKKLRAESIIPAVTYKKGKHTLPLKVDGKELFHILHTSAGENAIITLKIKDADKGETKDKTVIIKDIQYGPIKGNILHVDFHEISLTEKITVNVSVEAKGEAEGVKVDGGVLDHPIKEIQIECFPTQIPEKIDVHVEELKIGDSIRVKDLEVPEEVTVLSDPEQTVISVMAPRVEEVVEEEVVEGEAQEPEVIREKKPEDEAKEAEGKEAPPEPEAKQDKKE
ncbi:MAG: 50S ribosomal protein L25 [Candidatus Omnitrophica bacterium]|nr:50S ribosomal protein L25 [Candidatus Omnitrophota bacterium]